MKRYIGSNRVPNSAKIHRARLFLYNVDPDKLRLVEMCRNDILSLYSFPEDMDYETESNRVTAKESEIIRDYKSIAAENWEDCTVDEVDKLFDRILSYLDDSHSNDAAAWI